MHVSNNPRTPLRIHIVVRTSIFFSLNLSLLSQLSFLSTLDYTQLDYRAMSETDDEWWEDIYSELQISEQGSSQSPDYGDTFPAFGSPRRHHPISSPTRSSTWNFPEDLISRSRHVMDNSRNTNTPLRPVNDSTQNVGSSRDIQLHPPSQIPPVAAPGLPVPYQVDLRELEYVETYDQNLMCAICHCPFVIPVKLDCDHVFCQDCVNQALLHTDTCPSCRKRAIRPYGKAVPKIIDRILDELVVKCPLYLRGCSETVKRGNAQSHVDQYCGYTEVNCPLIRCPLKARRKDIGKTWCRHIPLSCRDCCKIIMEQDLEQHREEQCEKRKVSCLGCNTEILYQDFKEHASRCSEAVYPCDAAEYGCDFVSKRASLDLHLTTCPLHKLTPFLRQQKARLEDHEVALNHLQRKNSMLEASLTNLQELLSTKNLNAPSSSTSRFGTASFDSLVGRLLSLHGSIRDEVAQVSASVAELDAKATMMAMNESLRNKDDIALTNAALSNVRMQVHFLMSTRLQNQQKTSMAQPQCSSDGGRSLGGGSSTGGTTNLFSPSVERQLSSSPGRQETKL